MGFMYGITSLLVCLIWIWLGSGLIMKSVEKLSGGLKQSSFTISFIVLGFFTSLSEISVAINSTLDKSPQVSVGNLLGGPIVLILFIIPLVTILGKGLKLDEKFGYSGVWKSILLLALPYILLIDGVLTSTEGVILLFSYFIVLHTLISKKKTEEVVDTIEKAISKRHILKHSMHILIGAVILFTASNFLVELLINTAKDLGISPFLLSLLALSLGTNTPEISLGIRSALSGKVSIAFGNYLGSAVCNILILAILTITNAPINIDTSFAITSVISISGFTLFLLFIQSERSVSGKEAVLLLFLYVLFVLLETKIIPL